MLHHIKTVTATVPVHVLIRPRSGDFCFSEYELQTMLIDIDSLSMFNVEGIVIGALTEDGNVDVEACQRMIDIRKGLSTTFNRAFDLTRDPFEALETVIELGCQRILTSGCKPNCSEGAQMIKELIERAAGRITIVPGGGINEANLLHILEVTKATEFHGSATEPSPFVSSSFAHNSVVEDFGPVYMRCSRRRVRDMLAIAKEYWRISVGSGLGDSIPIGERL